MKQLFMATLCSLAMFSNAQQLEDINVLGSDFSVGVNAEVNANGLTTRNGTDINMDESFVSLSAAFKDKVRAVITADLQEAFNGAVNDEFQIGEFVREAYIEIREVAGKPIALVIGKQPVAFGQNVQAMPQFANSPMQDLQRIERVYGFTVDLEEGLFGLVDQAEISVYESEGGDLEIGKVDGISVRLSKMLTDSWLLTASHSNQGNSHLNTGREHRTSIGLIGESTDGYLVGYIEGIVFGNNPEYQDSNFALTVGGIIKVHETTDVVVEYNYINKEIHEIGLGVKTALTRNLTMGAEVRFQKLIAEDRRAITFGIGVTYNFGTSRVPRNPNYLFGEESDEDIFNF